MIPRTDDRWSWSDLVIVLASIGAAFLLLLVIRHHAGDTRIPQHPAACVQQASPDGRGMPSCDGSDPTIRGAA